MPNSSAPKNPDRSHDDDSWEQLESELFGIPYGKEHAPAPSNDPTESRDDESDVTPADTPPAAEIPPAPAPAVSVAADPELNRRYRAVARELGDFERGEALRALDDATALPGQCQAASTACSQMEFASPVATVATTNRGESSAGCG